MLESEAQLPEYLSISTSLRIWFKAITQPSLMSYYELAAIRTKPLQAYGWILVSGFITDLIIFMFKWGMGINKQRPINSTDLRTIIIDPLIALILFFLLVSLIHVVAKILGGNGMFEKLAFTVSCFYTPMNIILVVLSQYIYVSIIIFILYYIFMLYIFILLVLAVKAVHGLSSMRSCISTLLPYLAGSLIFILFLFSKYISSGK